MKMLLAQVIGSGGRRHILSEVGGYMGEWVGSPYIASSSPLALHCHSIPSRHLPKDNQSHPPPPSPFPRLSVHPINIPVTNCLLQSTPIPTHTRLIDARVAVAHCIEKYIAGLAYDTLGDCVQAVHVLGEGLGDRVVGHEQEVVEMEVFLWSARKAGERGLGVFFLLLGGGTAAASVSLREVNCVVAELCRWAVRLKRKPS